MKHPCKHPGCRVLLDCIGYCEAHQASAPQPRRDYDKRRANDPRLALAASIRNSAKWKRVQRDKLSANPLCEDPFQTHAARGDTETAKQVHHIKGLADNPELRFDAGNLMSVCTRCHSRLERQLRETLKKF